MTGKRKTDAGKAGVERLFEATEIQEYDIHPDGTKAVCSINTGDNWELATLDLRSGRTNGLLTGGQSLMSPEYSPCGTKVAYHADFEGNEDHDIFVVSAEGGRPRRVTKDAADNQGPRFSPDGQTVAFISNRDGDIENLFVSDIGGRRVRKLSREELPVRTLDWSPDGSRIAYGTGIGDEDYISVADVAKGKARRVLHKRGVEYGIEVGWGGAASPWSPDGRRLLFTSNENDASDVGALDMATGRSRWLVRSKNEKHSPQWSPDGRKLAYLEIEDPCVLLKVKEGRATKVVSPREGFTRSARWLPDGSGLVMVNGSSVRPEEVFVARTSRPEKVTSFQRKELPRGWLVRPKVVRYRSFDGRRVPALLFEPRRKGRRAGVVMPHGGPEMQSIDSWDQIIQILAMMGFHVILPNYRGSTGYGREFLHLHDRDLGGGDLMDTVFAGSYLVDEGMVDDDRVGIWGVSYGGYLCLLAMTKAPEVWAAGVSIVGFFDWETEMATERGFLKAYDMKKMGDPVRDRDFMRERSPAYYLDRIQAPLMMTASARDVRCPPTESRAVVEKLRGMGRTVAYHEYPDEGHWPRKRRNLVDLFTRTAGFLDENIQR
ncbi:MAG: S9 family peptidase [Candidatus Thermoplasmatota archaeon]